MWNFQKHNFLNTLLIPFSKLSSPEVAKVVIRAILQNAFFFFFYFLETDLRPKACNFIKKETLAQVFSCEFYEVYKNVFFTEHVWATASAYLPS